ncbi:hypothetical protein CWB99_03740 [Pseudoalteromonas rubra]|uniref:Uncharacterized protein n=1 Tax=Pseudoalteromonas rubra TaxID=43658 RepID=A0A5S3WQX7_9GAMM|nr:hypothetical protein CWB99_03740 [Pseudoalteromonas rubra]TMP34463.1 hypothetical protein CWC00_06645 [Pseudoalteromonas rubra]
MNNYIKVPLPKYTELTVELFNQAIRASSEWDEVTIIKSIDVHSTSLNLTLTKSNGELSTQEDKVSIHNILESLGFIYEYNL